MFSLYEIVQNAQGGQAVDNLARQFNISPDEADAAVKALMPAMSTAFLRRAAEPAAFSSILGALGDQQHSAAFSDPSAAQSGQTVEKGGQALHYLFGSTATNNQVAQHAAGIAGLPPALIQQMLPVVVSLVLGGLNKGLANQGLGGVIGQLANAAAQGGLGSILGGMLGGAGPAHAQPGGAPSDPRIRPPAAPPDSPGGLGGLGTILGGLLGGAGPAQAQPPLNQQTNPGAPGAPGGPGGIGGILGSILGGLLGGRTGSPTTGGVPSQTPGGIDPSTVQAGLDALIKMLQPGTPPPASSSQQAGLQNEINSILAGKHS